MSNKMTKKWCGEHNRIPPTVLEEYLNSNLGSILKQYMEKVLAKAPDFDSPGLSLRELALVDCIVNGTRYVPPTKLEVIDSAEQDCTCLRCRHCTCNNSGPAKSHRGP